MEQEFNKFSVISKIYSQFTEKNKENLLKTAMNLLEVQKKDAVMLAEAIPSKNEKKKQDVCSI